MGRRSVLFSVLVLSLLLTVWISETGTLAAGELLQTSPPANGRSTPQINQTDNPFLVAMQADATPIEGQPTTWMGEILQIIGRLLLAVVLSGLLAFRPRQNVPLFRRSLFVSQTQILLSMVAAALMMIVGNNAARAFAIFAAVSFVRFRTNIRDPKEITVLLISLALGLAAGVGRWDLGIALCLFSLALLWLLEHNESMQVYRSMELTVRTRDPERAQDIVKKLLKKYKLDAEMREITPPDAKTGLTSVVFYTSLRLSLSTDHLTERIMRLDPENIEGIQWAHKKGVSDMYQ